jgi:DNA-binding HxlR family transcriptional regulator
MEAPIDQDQPPAAAGHSRADARASTGLEDSDTADAGAHPCCPFYHEAVELVGRRWTGAILRVLMERPMRFSEVVQAVPELSDRLLSARMKELEARGLVQRTVYEGPPLRVEYSLSDMGRALEPALSEIERWARRWLRAGTRS